MEQTVSMERPRDSMYPGTTIIIPAYNEEMGLNQVLTDILGLSLPSEGYEVIVVDDGSIDNTQDVARRFVRDNGEGPTVKAISHVRNKGKGVAMMTGVRHARGENLIFIDADNTYPVETIPGMVEALETGYDMVVGSRIEGDGRTIPIFNQLGNRLFRFIFRQFYGSQNSDPLSGLYGIKSEEFKKMDIVSSGFQVETEITIKSAAMGLKVANIPIEYNDRLGETKLHPLKDGYRIMRALGQFAPLNCPHKIFTIPGALLFTLGVMSFLMVSFNPAIFRVFMVGIHTFLLSNLLIIIGIQLMVFGISTDLYAVLHKFRKSDHVGWFTAPRLLSGVRGAGVLSLLAGLYLGAGIFHSWIGAGFGSINLLEDAVATSTFIILGVQLAYSSSYLGIFSGQLSRREEVRLHQENPFFIDVQG